MAKSLFELSPENEFGIHWRQESDTEIAFAGKSLKE